ncbi:ubiquitin domain-containing protein 2 [Engraulis encrasicolus]|uniref:ubiquitin domain-containing protein 2 n=1 Tax=Engraulis encrasicolus TaxID=184585 RepID=UPI002FD12B3A
MGGCVGSHHDSSGSLNENSDGTGVALGRNQPLKREKPKWKSDYPMTDGQLRSKRDEFWDTAPAFEGRKEIWDALKAAAQAFEGNDHELAQAIIDGASITLPHGALTECYDELGNRYQLPVYCLCPPVNMIEEKSGGCGGAGEEELEPLDSSSSGGAGDALPPASEGQECQLRLRLSTGRDLRLSVRTTDTVQQMKRRLQATEGVAAGTQRWFFSGRPLTDKMKLDELKISRDYVVQVIVSQPPQQIQQQSQPSPQPSPKTQPQQPATPTTQPLPPQTPTPVEN